MQVLPATFKAYNPQGNIDNPYDNTVGGLRYIKDLYSKTNDAGLTAVGYYGGPKAIEKAKKGIAVSDPRNPNAPNTLQYMEQVMGRTKGAPARQQQRPAVPKTIREAAPELGPSYQAALALMAKADDLSEAKEKIAEEEEFASTPDYSQARQMLANLQPISGFKAQEPRTMAHGGEVKNPAHNVQGFKAGGMVREMVSNAGLVKKVQEAQPAPPPERTFGGSFNLPIPAVAQENLQPNVPTRPLESFVRRSYGYEWQGTFLDPKNFPSYTPPPMVGSFTPSFRPPAYDTVAQYQLPIRMMAEGGEATKKSEPGMGEKIKGTAKEVMRSMQYAPYDLLGAPVDIGNLALKGVDYLTGSKLATDKPVGGSEYLIQKSRELGIADEPTGSTTETLTRLGTGIVSPTAGPRAVAGAVKAAKGTAKAALEDLAMAGTGQGGSKIAQKIMEPGTAFAVRPKGGVFLGARSIDEPPLTSFDIQVRHFTEDLNRADPQQAEVVNFLDKKLRNFVMKDLGTADDPVFKKMISGEIPNYTYATGEELAAARAGNQEALKKVRDAYDASLNMNFYIGKPQANQLSGNKGYSYVGDVEKQIRKKIKEQSPDSPTELMVTGTMVSPEDIQKYPGIYGAPGFKQMIEESESGALMRMMNQSDLPPHVRRAIAEGEPVFAQTTSPRRVMDITELRDYLLTRSPNDIKNMGVADAIAKSKQWHARMEAARRDPSKLSPKQLFEGTKEMLPTADNMKWVDVRTPDALSLEGNIMGHCVGGSNYCNAVAKETTKIVSLRDKKGVPHVTIEIQKDRDGKFSRIAQIKGTGNNSPEKYFTQVDDFLKDYSSKLGGDLSITERPNYVPPDWRYK